MERLSSLHIRESMTSFSHHKPFTPQKTHKHKSPSYATSEMNENEQRLPLYIDSKL
jgi:hypothetical protein